MLYDWVWFIFSSASNTGPVIKRWAIPNTVAATIYLLCFSMFRFGQFDRTWFELLVAAVTFLFSIPDGIQLNKGRLP